jgi:hypothetical protein
MARLTLTLCMRSNIHAHVDVDLAVIRRACIACIHAVVKTQDDNMM